MNSLFEQKLEEKVISLEQESELDENRFLLAYLANKLYLNPKKLELINQSYSSLKIAFDDRFAKILNKTEKTKWTDSLKELDYNEIINQVNKLKSALAKSNIDFITYQDSTYPETFKELKDFPLVIYYQGNLKLLEDREMLTVVGSRNIQNYTRLSMEHLLKPICRRGVNIVSGLAIGIDTLSHKISLESGSKTIAIVGSGLDDKSLYPQQNLELKQKILESDGLILSEYVPGFKGNLYSFPRRNRLLAALGKVTIIFQANLQSGSLITSTAARELKRNVATIPGSILDSSFEGNHELIKTGASIITKSDDILKLMGVGLSIPNQTKEVIIESESQRLVYQALTLSGQTIENLSLKTNMNITELGSELTMLELDGLAVSLGENIWARGA